LIITITIGKLYLKEKHYNAQSEAYTGGGHTIVYLAHLAMVSISIPENPKAESPIVK